MTEEDKKLLLKDLCARLPYGVKCGVLTHPNCRLSNWKKEDDLYYKSRPKYQTLDLATLSINPIECFKPYLRPMSSMTEGEKSDFPFPYYFEWIDSNFSLLCSNDKVCASIGFDEMYEIMDWLNVHHFDYRGLIEKGLALEAPEDMYKEN